MQKLTLPAILLFWSNLLFGQTFMANPDAVLTKELQFNQANECYIYFINPSGDSLHLRWRLVESNLPDNWVADLCDYGTCYNGIPSNGLMSPVYDTIQPYLKLIVQPGENAGACWIWFRAYENGNQANYADVFFNLHTTGTLQTGAPSSVSAIEAFPNPASEVLQLKNSAQTKIQAEIMNMSGARHWKGSIPPVSVVELPVSHWPAGTYLLLTGQKIEKIQIQH